MYHIIPQTKGEDTVNCKVLTRFASTDANGDVSFVPIKFPCLKVLIGSNTDDGKFSVVWSYFHHQHKLGPQKGQPIVCEAPGKFKLRRVEMRRPMLYLKDHNNRTVKNADTGKPEFDFLAMASQWGTEAEYVRGKGYVWTFGANHPIVEETIWEEEYESIDTLNAALTQRFGDELANDVCIEFFQNELYQTYDLTAQETGSDDDDVAEAIIAHAMRVA